MEKIRGSIDVPLDDNGKRRALEIGQAFDEAGEPFTVISSHLDRADETARRILAMAPQGRSLGTTEALSPWKLGALEGRSVKEAKPQMKLLVTMPQVAAPGRAPEGTAPGESFDSFKNRFLNYYKSEAEPAAEHVKKLVLVTHHRNIRLLDSWLRAGRKDNHEIDMEHFTDYGSENNQDAPGEVFKVGARGLKKVEEPKGPGIYLVRHGETEFNR